LVKKTECHGGLSKADRRSGKKIFSKKTKKDIQYLKKDLR